MAASSKEMETRLLALPAKERARIAARLIDSLDTTADPEVDQAWLEEAERRLDELESGSTESVLADRVFEKADSGGK